MKNMVNNLKAGVQTVKTELEKLYNGTNLKRHHVVKVLGIPSASLAELTKALRSNTFKSYPDVIELRDSVRTTTTTCLNLSELVATGKIKPRELMVKLGEIVKSFSADIALADACIAYLPQSKKSLSLDDLSEDDRKDLKKVSQHLTDMENQVNDQKAIRREEREDAATAKTGRVLQRLKAKYFHKVPRKFNSSIQILQLPVMARFGTLAMSPESLSRMGFKIETAGLHSTPSSDLGIIFENQLLMFFRMSDAKAVAEEEASRYKSRDGTLVERKRLQKERNAERRELKKLNALLEKQTALKVRRKIQAQIDSSQADIDDITAQLDDMDAKVRVSNSNARVHRVMTTSNDHAMLNYLNPILDTLNEKSSSTLGLFTTMPLRGIMPDADVHVAWIMEKSAINLLLRHTGGDVKLQNWFMPWSNG
ncbi:hypothetical protein pEaSNUABM52_00335 [Erwinia phage pEp_SNUABM_52]|nr:hypothetical protein pEaSNUABM52_00335 [Erwinia phage pEp_SNUABM_52]